MKAYDLLVQAETGLCYVTGNAAGPARVGVSVCDIAAGMYAHAAILQALYARRTTGQGRVIKVSLFSGMADWMNVPYLQRRYGGSEPPRLGLAHPSIAPYGAYACRGGDILFSVQNEREWAALCRDVLGDASLATDPRFSDGPARVAHRTALDRIIARVFGSVDRASIIERLQQADIAFGLVNDIDGLIAHPQLKTVTYDTPAGPVAVIAPAAEIVGAAPAFRPVPDIGAQDAALRTEFG
jgi:crotonobetainyl-CoA:carnitine CoA-transferase CaiB-like acyl-CoA transferase